MQDKKVVLVACGTGVATSTVVNAEVKKIAREKELNLEVIQCKISEVPGYADRADILITTTVVNKNKYNFPVINGRPFLTGIGKNKVIEEITAQLT